MRLAGKTAVVTGGGSGIGQAIAWVLAGEGCRVAVAGRSADKLEATIRGFIGSPAIIGHTVDVADRASVAAFFRWAERELGKIDILVNNSGINVPKRYLSDISPEDWDRTLTVNATGAFNCLREVLPAMRTRRDGLVVNISSTSGKRAGLLGGVAYSASKFALTALATAAALEEGKHGIRVTSIFPGEVDTPILEHRPVPVSAEHRARILQPDDVAQAVLMVCCLPPRAHVAELVIKPTTQDYC